MSVRYRSGFCGGSLCNGQWRSFPEACYRRCPCTAAECACPCHRGQRPWADQADQVDKPEPADRAGTARRPRGVPAQPTLPLPG